MNTFYLTIVEWNGMKWSESCSFVSDSLQPHGLYGSWNSPGQNTGVGSCSLLQGIFPTQGLNPGFPHCRQILYQLATREALVEWNTSCHISGQEMSQSSVILGLPNVNEGSPKGMQCLLSRRFDAPYGDCWGAGGGVGNARSNHPLHLPFLMVNKELRM